MRLYYMAAVSLDEGPCSRGDPEDGAGSGVLRPRLVTAGSGGPGNRRPGNTTRPRTCRSSFGANAGGMSMRLPEQKAPDGAPGGRRPLQVGGMRRLATGARADLASPPGRLRRGARRLPGAPCPSPAREKEEGKGRRPAPENASGRAAQRWLERVQQKWEPVLRPNALYFLSKRAFRAANRIPLSLKAR